MSSTPTSSAHTEHSTPTNSSVTGFQGTNPAGFYRNLFYILIGLLCAFVVVSFATLCRTRYRRRAIIAEANRLGVMVPGVPGYISLRERVSGSWAKADGSILPDWWQVVEIKREPPVPQDLSPISITPMLAAGPPVEPIPISPLKYFPQNLAYRPEMYAPPRSVPDDLNELVGTTVDVGVLVRMPVPVRQDVGTEDDLVIKEWQGVQVGIMAFEVKSGAVAR